MTLVSYLEPFNLQRWPDTWVVKLDASPVTVPDDDADPFEVRLEATNDWVPESIQWNANGVPTTLNLRRILGQGNGKTEDYYPERVQLLPGTTVVLERATDDGETEQWFRGHVGQSHLMIQPENHALNAIAYGPELLLNAVAVVGQWTKTTDADDMELTHVLTDAARIRENIWQTYLPCIFNENGLPNCSRATDNSGDALGWKLDTDATTYTSGSDNPCRVFEASNRVVTTMGQTTAELKAVHWTAYRALRSLIEWYDHYSVISWDTAPWTQLEASLDSMPLPEVNVQGMGLGDAITEILRAVGYGWCLSPWPVFDAVDCVPRHRLFVYSLTTPKTSKSPLLPPLSSHATDDDAWRAMVERFEYLKDSHNVKPQVIVIGDQEREQLKLWFAEDGDLRPYWNTSFHVLSAWAHENEVTETAIEAGGLDPENFMTAYNSDGSGFAGNENVFRGFGLNEDGHMGPTTIAVMPSVFGANSMRRQRPMGPCIEYDRSDAQMRHYPAQVWLGLSRNSASIAGSEVRVAARVWHDHCGFTLLEGSLLQWHPWAGSDKAENEVYAGGPIYEDVHYLTCLHNTIAYQTANHDRLCLQIYIIGTIETDITIRATGDGSTFVTWPIKATKVIEARHRFRKRSVEESGPWSTTAADTRDDVAITQTYADNIVEAVAPPVGHGSMMLRHITRAWHPGMGIFETDGRRIDLTVDLARAKCAIVAGVRWNFAEGANKTELLLDTQLLGLIQ